MIKYPVMPFGLINIVPYNSKYQLDIDVFMDAIEKEFVEPVSMPDAISYKMDRLSKDLAEKYWVALAGERAAGTIGLRILASDSIVIKRLFIAKAFRRSGIGRSLLLVVLSWARENGIRSIYLGTMTQFREAQKFYIKNGFSEVDQSLLPNDFPLNPVDSVFYGMVI